MRYEEAIQSFKDATEIDPSMTAAYLYLATAYSKLYVPGAKSDDTKKYASLAIQSFLIVLEKDPTNATAYAGLASIYHKDNQLQKARGAYLRSAELDPQNPVVRFGVGSIDLAIVAEESSTLSAADKARLIEEGLQHLKQAIALNPNYDQAMATMSLLLRQNVAIAQTENEKRKLEAEASSWEAKSLESRQNTAKQR